MKEAKVELADKEVLSVKKVYCDVFYRTGMYYRSAFEKEPYCSFEVDTSKFDSRAIAQDKATYLMKVMGWDGIDLFFRESFNIEQEEELPI